MLWGEWVWEYPDPLIAFVTNTQNGLGTKLAISQKKIRQLSRESAPDVDSWIKHAKSLQDDIDKSRKMANDIVRQAKVEEDQLDSIEEKEDYVIFLSKEMSFNAQLGKSLRAVKAANDLLNQAEQLAVKTRIHESLMSLEGMIPLDMGNLSLTHEQMHTILRPRSQSREPHALYDFLILVTSIFEHQSTSKSLGCGEILQISTPKRAHA